VVVKIDSNYHCQKKTEKTDQTIHFSNGNYKGKMTQVHAIDSGGTQVQLKTSCSCLKLCGSAFLQVAEYFFFYVSVYTRIVTPAFH
jgi:hypothetical protein